MNAIDRIKEKKCFIFDLDGTLIDSLSLWMTWDKDFASLKDAYQHFKPIYRDSIQAKPNSREFLEFAYNAGYTCAIATATDLAVCGACIKRLGFDEFLANSFCCADFHTTKSSPAFYNSVLNALGFEKKEVVIFEDNSSWARIAYDDGFDIIGVDDYHTNDFADFDAFALYKLTDYHTLMTELKD